MAIDMSKLSQSTRKAISEMSRSEWDLKHLSASEAFDYFLRYYGIVGYTGLITRALDEIRAADENA